MKIHPDQIEGVRPEQQNQVNKTQKPGESFGDFLNQEITRTDAQPQSKVAAPPVSPMAPLLGVQAVQPVSPLNQEQQAVVQKVEGLLDQWEGYAGALTSDSPAPLKQAHAALNRIADDVQGIKEEWPDLATDHPKLQELVNELDVMAQAEQFKFNRGDYL